MNVNILNGECKGKLFFGYNDKVTDNDQVTDNDDDKGLMHSLIMMPQVVLNPSTNAATAAFKKLMLIIILC